MPHVEFFVILLRPSLSHESGLAAQWSGPAPAVGSLVSGLLSSLGLVLLPMLASSQLVGLSFVGASTGAVSFLIIAFKFLLQTFNYQEEGWKGRSSKN